MKKVVNYIHSHGQWFYEISDEKYGKLWGRPYTVHDSKSWVLFAEDVSKSKAKKVLIDKFGEEYEYAICYFFHWTPNWYHSKRRGSREYGHRRRNPKYIYAKYDYIGDIEGEIE